MSNSGNTLSKKMIAIIVIIAILLIAAITAVVVFLRDQGQTSAMAENNPQSAAEQENAQQEQQDSQQPAEQSVTSETPSADDSQIPTDVASADNAGTTTSTTTGTDNAGTTAPSTTGTTTPSTTSTSNNGGNGAGTTGNNGAITGTASNADANNIQETEITDTTTVYNEETHKVEEGEILSWTPQALAATVSGVSITDGLNLNAPNFNTTKTSVVLNKDNSESTDQTTVDLTQKVKYTITISNVGNATGTIYANNISDTLPDGFDYSSAKPEDYEFNLQKTDVNDNPIDAGISFSDITFEGLKATLNKDVTLGAGEKLTITYSLKVNPDFLKNEDGTLKAFADLAKNVVTVNNVPTEDEKEYDAVQPIIKAAKTSVITRNGVEVAGTAEDPAKVGDVVEYTIHIANDGNADTTVIVKDTNLADILTKADFLEASRSDNEPISREDLLNEMNITMYKNTTLDIKFKVQIKDVSGMITNGIIVTKTDTEDPNPDPEVEDPDEIYTVNIKAEKHASTTTVKEKEDIKYTITLTNTGNTAGSTVVKDTIPEGTTFKAGTIEINGIVEATKTEDDLKNGINVTVPGNNGTATVAFVVTANVLPEGQTEATIRNTAIVGEGEDEKEVPSEENPTVDKSYVSLTVNKNWSDNEIQSNRREPQITFELLANGNTTGKTETINSVDKPSNTQSYTFERLSKYDQNGNVINYSVKEVNVGNFYNSVVGTPTMDALGNQTVTVTNTFKTPEQIKEMTKDYTVTKVWSDKNNAAGKRTESVELTVSGNETTTPVTLSAENKVDDNTWQTNVTLPQYNANGEEITYLASEATVPQFYTATTNVLTVTNTFEVPTTTVDVKINKKWVDNDIQAQRRPTQIKFTLKANGTSVAGEKGTYIMNVAGDNQEYTFKDLPMYDENANVIEYDVDESVVDGEGHKDDLKFYNSTKTENGTNNIQFINTFTKPTDENHITVTKVWKDNNYEGRPENVTVSVIGSANGKEAYRDNVVINKVEGTDTWTQEVTVPVYDDNANEITYSVQETNVPDGYIASAEGLKVTNARPSLDIQKDVKEVIHNDGTKTEVPVPNNNATINVVEGDIVHYVIKVTNNSNVTIPTVNVTDNLNVSKEINGTTTHNIATLTNFIGGDTATYDVYYNVLDTDTNVDGKTTENIATATGTYVGSDNKEYTIEVSNNATVTAKDVDDISITKVQKDSNGKVIPNGAEVEYGTVINYTITVKNEGNTVLHNVVITDEMTGNTSDLNINGDLTIGDLAVGETKKITASYTVGIDDISTTSKSITNTATVKADKVPEESSTVTVNTEVGKADIDVTKTSTLIKAKGYEVKGKAEYGDTIKYTITATNKGNIPGSTTVKDTVPTGTDLLTTGTNLTPDELTKLDSEDGLTKVLENIPANGGTKTITFSVKVVAKPGENITNTATVTDKDNTTTEKSDEGQDVEKSIKVTKQTQTQTITNSNVVIVLDVSDSMNNRMNAWDFWGDSKLSIAKQTVNEFIDSVNLSNDGDGSLISVVTFNGASYGNTSGTDYTDVLTIDRKGNTIASTADDAEALKKEVNDITADGGTCISGALTRAKQQMDLLKAKKPENQDIVIFVGDGEPDGDAGDISGEAKKLKADVDVVYAVGFGKNISILQNTVASSKDKYFTTSDNVDLSDIFTQIKDDIAKPSEPEDETSVNGKVLLEDIDTSKEIEIKVDGNTISNPQSYIVTENGNKYLDLTKFDADAEIEISYISLD